MCVRPAGLDMQINLDHATIHRGLAKVQCIYPVEIIKVIDKYLGMLVAQ